MVMKASPTSSLKCPSPSFLFEFLVVPLDAPAHLRERDEAVEGVGCGQSKLGRPANLFSADKVWTSSGAAAARQGL